MKEMGEGACPFKINMDPESFKVGDLVSYRVRDMPVDMPFLGVLMEVNKDHVMLRHYMEDSAYEKYNPPLLKATREVRPMVEDASS